MAKTITSNYIGLGVEDTFKFSNSVDTSIPLLVTIDDVQTTLFTQDNVNFEITFNTTPIGVIKIITTILEGSPQGGGTGETTSLDTSNFNNNLSLNDDTVQKMADTLDDMSSGLEGFTEDNTNRNTAVGYQSQYSITNSAKSNCSLGYYSLYKNTSGDYNISIGSYSLYKNTSGNGNIAIGGSSLYPCTSNYNTAIGDNSLSSLGAYQYNTAIGYNSGNGISDYTNTTSLGANSTVTGDNQVQLGDSDTTTYAYGAVIDRSDMRDKADIIDNPLGLEFINKINPVQFKWDFREDYYNEIKNEDGKIIREYYEPDGSKKRSRSHNGVIAQQVKEVMDEMNVDFAGYKDASLDGGKDVLSIGYEEFISPMIKAIQELTERIEELENK